MSGQERAAKGTAGASKSAPIMPGCHVSAKRLSRIRGNIDALRHNWKLLLRCRKEMGCRERRRV
jgi:hypothetical protein